MKIVFVCGSLEPGRDGVGDYTRRLAGELIKQNHQVCTIAIHDRYLPETEIETTQQEEQQSISVLRLSARLPWNERIRKANSHIQAIDPDWVSLQYVPFSFHDKGLHISLGNLLKRVCNGRNVQIMFHELWVGMYTQAPKHYIWWGQLQRHLIRWLCIMLKPNVVHTHTPLYQVQLNRIGVQALLLPLFSNIPLTEKLTSRIGQPIFGSPDKLRFVLFGGIHPGSPASQLATEVAIYGSKKKIDVDLVIVGRSGPEQEIWAAAWRANGLAVRMLGEQPPVNISEILSQSSIGLSTTPVALSGKSGTIAAMHAHGLPVMCVSALWQPRNAIILEKALGILEYTIGNFERVVNDWEDVILPRVDVADVTRQFLDNLLTKTNQVQTKPINSL